MTPQEKLAPCEAKPSPDAEFARLLHRLSHDLKAPARAIVDLTSWIEEDLREAGTKVPEAVDSNLSLLMRRSLRMQSLIHDLMTYASVGTSNDMFAGEWFDVLAITLREVPDLSNYDFQTELGGVPAISVADLQTMLIALLNNATKHNPTGSGTIRLVTSEQSNGCLLRVYDTGPGIAPEKVDHAMQMFTTLSRKDNVEANGLGLPTVKRVADLVRGSFNLGPGHDGAGCCATVWLPNPVEFRLQCALG
jgi:signal transduction histidine kinase